MSKDFKILDNIQKITKNISLALEGMKEIPGMYDEKVDIKNKICAAIPEKIKSGIIKIAVVGTIKSGKSTFVNSFLNQDLLKRGAGVSTSIVTKVRKGKKPKTCVFFKSWDEINQEIEKAILCFPDFFLKSLNINQKSFDLRRKRDQELLKSVKDRISSDILAAKKEIASELLIITHALEGYEYIKDIVKADPFCLHFDKENIDHHKKFTSNNSLAFFVKKVLLYVVSNTLGPQVEIADCQGSDSTNPIHMAEIQNYLISANMIIYIITSRTGLRQADIKFLKIIQDMGLINNIFFVVNFDISEHESLDSLLYVENKIIQELTYIKEKPEVYTISSLYNLFKKIGSDISLKDKKRFNYWKMEKDFIKYSNKMNKKFNIRIKHKLNKDRELILVANHIQIIRKIVFSAEKRINSFKNFLSENILDAEKIAKKFSNMQKKVVKFQLGMENLTKGNIKVLTTEIEKDFEKFFHKSYGKASQKIKKFIQEYSIDFEKYEKEILKKGFNNSVYFMFQDFRFAMDCFLAQQFNPKIIFFIKEQEQKIEDHFKSLYESYNINPFKESLFFVEKKQKQFKADINIVDVQFIKTILGLTLPNILFTTRYSAGIRVEAIAKLGIYSIGDILLRILRIGKKPAGIAALKAVSIRIKKEFLRSSLIHISEYSDHIKNEYILALLIGVARDFNEKIIKRFKFCDIEIKKNNKLMLLKEEERKKQKDNIESLRLIFKDISHKIDAMPL